MNTFLSEDLQGLRSQYQQFAKEHLAPIANTLACKRSSLPEFLKLVAQAGYLSITVPKEYGGQGGTFLDLILFAEAMSFYEPGFALSLAGHTVVIELIKQYGSEAQKAHYLPLLASGEHLGAFAYAENDIDEIPRETAIRNSVNENGKEQKAGTRTLVGTRHSVINGKLASLFVVLATEQIEGESIPALWLVNNAKAIQSNCSRIDCRPKGAMLGLNSASIDEVQFEHCPLTEEDLLGSGHKLTLAEAKAVCKNQIDFAHNISKTIMAAAAVGLTEGALFLGGSYARSKQRFGAPLANSQSVQWKIADLAVESSAARLLTYRSAWSKDENSAEFSKNAAMCKSFAASGARKHSAEALQILGSDTNSPYSDLARLFTDAKAIEMIAGTTEEQKEILAIELNV
jgi:alkylation response protein AidB-like acyl-CoA dehydrogenase